jgi:hypothetical protein
MSENVQSNDKASPECRYNPWTHKLAKYSFTRFALVSHRRKEGPLYHSLHGVWTIQKPERCFKNYEGNNRSVLHLLLTVNQRLFILSHCLLDDSLDQ